MADHPMLFSSPMVRAKRDGIKTQTRRVFKEIEELPNGLFHIFGGMIGVSEEDVPKHAPDYCRIQPGDRIWARESFSYDRLDIDHDAMFPAWYWADGNPEHGDWTKPKPSIHMPRAYSRTTLFVEDVRVERLQSISEADALAEGVPDNESYAGSFEEHYCRKCGGSGLHGGFGANYGVIEVDCAECETPVMRYRNLWDHINGPDAWNENPWVVAYTFRVVLENIDRIGRAA